MYTRLRNKGYTEQSERAGFYTLNRQIATQSSNQPKQPTTGIPVNQNTKPCFGSNRNHQALSRPPHSLLPSPSPFTLLQVWLSPPTSFR